MSSKTPAELFGVECGKGWYPLIRPILNYIKEYNHSRTEAEHIQVFQVKEKWGLLNIYVDGATGELNEMVRQAEKMSGTICEKCGNPGSRQIIKGWYLTLCESCRVKEEKRLSLLLSKRNENYEDSNTR